MERNGQNAILEKRAFTPYFYYTQGINLTKQSKTLFAIWQAFHDLNAPQTLTVQLIGRRNAL